MKPKFKSSTLVAAFLLALSPLLSTPAAAEKDKITNKSFEDIFLVAWASASPTPEEIERSSIKEPTKTVLLAQYRNYKYFVSYYEHNVYASVANADLLYVPFKFQLRSVDTISVAKFNCADNTYAVKPVSERFFATSKQHEAVGGAEGLTASELLNYNSPTRDEKAVNAWFHSLDQLPLKRFNFSASKSPKDNFELLALQQLQRKFCAVDTKHSVKNKEENKKIFASQRNGLQPVISRLYKDSVKIETGDPEMWGYMRQPVYNPSTHNLDFLAQTFTVRTPSGLVSMDSEDKVRINCRALTSATVSLYVLYLGVREKYDNTLDKASEKLDKVEAETIVESENPVLYRTLQGLCAQYQSKMPLELKTPSVPPSLLNDTTLNN